MTTFKEWLELPENKLMKQYYESVETEDQFVLSILWDSGYLQAQKDINEKL